MAFVLPFTCAPGRPGWLDSNTVRPRWCARCGRRVDGFWGGLNQRGGWLVANCATINFLDDHAVGYRRQMVRARDPTPANVSRVPSVLSSMVPVDVIRTLTSSALRCAVNCGYGMRAIGEQLCLRHYKATLRQIRRLWSM